MRRSDREGDRREVHLDVTVVDAGYWLKVAFADFSHRRTASANHALERALSHGVVYT